MQKHVGKAAALGVRSVRTSKPSQAQRSPATPDKFTYALAAYTAERRKDGWHVAKTVPGFTGDKARWAGPFDTIENACLSMARHLAVGLADRHTRSIEAYRIDRQNCLFGLKPTTRLRIR